MSSVTNSVSSSASCTGAGEKYHMKQFIIAAQEYNTTKSDDISSVLSRNLQLLGVSLDINTFDPNSSIVAEFFVSLHELMSGLDSRSPLIWCGVSVLQQACRNPAAHKALIHTYQFLPILSRCLGDHLTRDKKRKMLTLMQELTYGINISWQISHLPHLITTLTKWIEISDEIIVSLSLGVLLNLCYKNLPVIYTLMRTVNTKHFLRTVMSMKNPSTEVQVCKLLIILEHINGEVPKDDILKFVRVTFKTIVEAFKYKDLIRLRHIVEFFLEVRGQRNRVEAVALYDNYYEDVVRLLDEVENNANSEKGDSRASCDLECMGLLFEFLHSLVDLQIMELQPIYARIINMTLGWVQTEVVCSKALALLKTVALCPQENAAEVLEPLATGLSVFLHIIDNQDAETLTHTENCKKISALLQLLKALVQNYNIRGKVLATLKQESLLKVFSSLIGNDLDMRVKETYSTDTNELYIHALALLCELADHNASWKLILMQIIQHKQIHAILAQAFFIDSQDTKILVFEMSKVPKFPMKEVTRMMCEIQPSVQAVTSSVVNSQSLLETVSCPIMSVTQIEQLDQAINKLKEAVASGEVSSIATSEVMELYEYKMSAIGHSERAAVASLEAANGHATHLQHRLAQMATELARLHQLLFHAQQCQEEAHKQLQQAHEHANTLTAKLTKETVRNKELTKQLSDKEKEIESHVTSINNLELKHSELMQNNAYLNKKYDDQVSKNLTLMKVTETIENNIKTLQIALDDSSETVVKCNKQIERMTREIQHLEELKKQHESIIATREKELAETQKELIERKKILDTITKLTTKS